MSAPRTVAEAGEFELIARLERICSTSAGRASEATGGAIDAGVIIGIGDDTAAIAIDPGQVLLATSDIQIEGVHFRRDLISSYQIGRRAMAVNLSDIAAMGGAPRQALVSLGLPGTFTVTDFDALFEGLRDGAARFGAAIIGGNLAMNPAGLVVDVTLLGQAPRDRILTRRGARPGDLIFLTGTIGASAAGAEALRRGLAGFDDLVHAHLEPEPRVAEGRRIAASGVATAMIDISDGLAADLGHLCEQSGVGAEIDARALSLLPSVLAFAARSGRDPWDHALHGGEDYELLFTARPGTEEAIARIAGELGTPMRRIGTMLSAAEGRHFIDRDGSRRELPAGGWDHFRRD